MDLRLPTPLNVKKMFPLKKVPLETTIDVIRCLAAMKVTTIILVGEPDMYRFIYNITRQRKNTLPTDFKYLSKGRKYVTVNLIDLNSLLIIRVR